MKLLHFLFDDFWRKLVALIFAVVIYWQAGGFVKKNEATCPAPPPASAEIKENVQIKIEEEPCRMDFPVGIIGGGTGRRAAFAPGVVPRVKVTLSGNDLSGIQTGGDLRFYVDADEFSQGKNTLRVYCHIRRPGIRVLSVTPEEIEVVEIPVK